MASRVVDEAAGSRHFICRVTPVSCAAVCEREHEAHRVLRTRLILLFAVFVREQHTVVVAHYLGVGEGSRHLHTSSSSWQVVDDLDAVPGLRGGPLCYCIHL